MKSNIGKLAAVLGVSLFMGGSALALTPGPYWSETNHNPDGGIFSIIMETKVLDADYITTTQRARVLTGRTLNCYATVDPAHPACNFRQTESVASAWTFATGFTITAGIPSNTLAVTDTYTVGRTFTDATDYSKSVSEGYRITYITEMDRRWRNADIIGARYKTGNTRQVRRCSICVQTNTQWEYRESSTIKTADLKMNIRQWSEPRAAFVVARL